MKPPYHLCNHHYLETNLLMKTNTSEAALKYKIRCYSEKYFKNYNRLINVIISKIIVRNQ